MKNKNLYTFLAINKISKILIILICCAFFSPLSNAANNNLIKAGSMSANPNPNDTVYPLQLSLTAYEYGNTFNVSCFGFKDGRIDLTVNGGTPPYTYQWSEGDTIEDIMNLPAGYYKVTVTDADSSIAEADITLTQPTPLKALTTEVTISKYPNGYNVSCINCFNGSLSVAVTGGSGEYIYSWVDDSLAGLSRTGLGAGNYIIDIRDTNVCSGGDEVKENIVLKEPPSEGWSMEGNANISTSQFIGTTDVNDLVFKTNNVTQMQLTPLSNTGTRKITLTGDGEINDNFSIGKNLLVGGSFKMDSLAGVGFLLDSVSTKSYKLLFADEEGNVVCKKPVPNSSPAPCNYDNFGPIPWLTNGNIIGDNGTSILGTCDYKPIYFRTNGEHRMIITETGNIGIGTNYPQQKLHVDGNAVFIGNVCIGTTTSTDKLQIGDGIESMTFGSALVPNAGYLVGYQGYNAHRSSLTSSWLISNGNVNSGGAVIATDVTGSIMLIPVKATGSGFTLTDAELIERRVVLIGAGSMNGGNLVDAYMKVNGKIITKEVEVTLTNWPDIVFEKNYILTPLAEIEKYINKYKHLPNIPSATEVAKNGVALGETQALLLQKIEELTLYMIELSKKNEALQKEVDLLKKAK